MNLSTITSIILLLLLLVVIVFLIIIGINITRYIISKRNYIEAEETHLDTIDANTIMSMSNEITLGDKISYTTDAILLINTIIDNNIADVLLSYRELDKKYEMKKMGDNIKAISENVYNSFKKELYTHPQLLVTDEFLMQHIMNETSRKLLSATTEYNNSIYSGI